VRPERRVLLASASLARVSAGAPGSRPQAKAEMPPARAGRQKPLKETGARKRAATSSERCSHVIVSAERCLKGPSRSCHGEGNRQQPGPERLLDLSGVWGGGTFPEQSAEQERPYLAAQSGEDCGVPGRTAEVARSREGVRGVRSTVEGVQDNVLEGRDPALIGSSPKSVIRLRQAAAAGRSSDRWLR
jgi:hypothetical protein